MHLSLGEHIADLFKKLFFIYLCFCYDDDDDDDKSLKDLFHIFGSMFINFFT